MHLLIIGAFWCTVLYDSEISRSKFMEQSRRCNNRSDRKYFTRKVRSVKSDKQREYNFCKKNITSSKDIFVFLTKYLYFKYTSDF